MLTLLLLFSIKSVIWRAILLMKYLIYIFFLVIFFIVIYFALIIKVNIIFYFLLHYKITTLFKKKQYFIIDFLSSKSLVKLLLSYLIK